MVEFEEQPTVYNDTEEDKQKLIDWLEWDLYEQRTKIMCNKNKTDTSFYVGYDSYRENEALKDIIDNAKLVLNIGFSNDGVKVEINFNFDFRSIISQLLDKEIGEFKQYTCPYNVNCGNLTFSDVADFNGATFTDRASFSSTTFGGQADFRRAIFTGKADFIDTTFTSEAHFNSATFKGVVDFRSATFKNDADFSEATFTNDAIFRSATFTDDANFRSATFKQDAHFSAVIFPKDANFSKAKFKENAFFGSATFTNDAHFTEATFTSDAHFTEATFTSDANFSEATFTSDANFREATFTNEVHFTDAKFTNDANFTEVKFTNDADFSGATFQKETNFNMTNFNTCKFSRAIFKDKANFESAIFEEKTDFGLSRKEYDLSPEPRTTFEQEANFERAKFKGEADFKYVVFKKKANFRYTIFKDEADFKFSSFNCENDSDSDSNSFFNAIFEKRGAFYYITLLRTLYFDNIKMNDETNIYFGETNCENENADDSKIMITNTIISGRIDLRNANVGIIDFKTSRVVGSGSVTNTIKNLSDKFANWETASLFKSEEIKGVNTIKALEYKAREKDLYKEFIKDRREEIVDEINLLKRVNLIEAIKVIVFTVLRKLFFKNFFKDYFADFFKDYFKDDTKDECNRIKLEINTLKQTMKKKNIKEVLKNGGIETDKNSIQIRRKKIEDEIQKLKQEIKNSKKNTKAQMTKFARDAKPQIKEFKKEKFKYFWESLSIRLSKLSNNHGQNWGQAVLFTILSGLVCFTIFYAPHSVTRFFDCGLWEGYLHSLAEYYIPINYEVLIDYLTDSQLSWVIKICGLLVYFLGKIAVAYGMVEIVQAFRKLK